MYHDHHTILGQPQHAMVVGSPRLHTAPGIPLIPNGGSARSPISLQCMQKARMLDLKKDLSRC